MNGPVSPLDDPDSTASGWLGGDADSTRPHGRHAHSRDELIRRLTAMMQSWEGCEKVRVLEIYRLDPPDNVGCNWSSTLMLEPNGTEPEVYALGYGAIIATARESWNLA
jgi:hypothetical protein